MCVGKNKTKTGINFRIYFGGSVFLRLPVTAVRLKTHKFRQIYIISFK
jgi:hypothetical protein